MAELPKLHEAERAASENEFTREQTFMDLQKSVLLGESMSPVGVLFGTAPTLRFYKDHTDAMYTPGNFVGQPIVIARRAGEGSHYLEYAGAIGGILLGPITARVAPWRTGENHDDNDPSTWLAAHGMFELELAHAATSGQSPESYGDPSDIAGARKVPLGSLIRYYDARYQGSATDREFGQYSLLLSEEEIRAARYGKLYDDVRAQQAVPASAVE